jgi:hypothetical protein
MDVMRHPAPINPAKTPGIASKMADKSRRLG